MNKTPETQPETAINNIVYQKIFIGGISSQLIPARLEKIFIEAIKFYDCPQCDIVTVQCFPGYGFIILKNITEENLLALIENIQLSYNGQRLHMKKALGRNEVNLDQITNRKKKILVKDLTHDITGLELENYFKKIGPLDKCYVAYSPDNGQHRGFGFVTFQNEEDSKKAIKAIHHSINGVRVTCCTNYTKQEVKNHKKNAKLDEKKKQETKP